MYLCYVDESGHCGKKFDPNQPVEVLCGVLTDFTKLNKTQRQQRELLSILEENGIPLKELKAADAYRGRGAWSKVKPTVRDRVYKTILSWMNERDCKVIVAPIDSGKFFDLKVDKCAISQYLRYPYEAGALNVVLAIQRLQKSKKSNKGNTVVVFDEQQGHDDRLMTLFESDFAFTDCYTGYKVKPRAKTQEPRLNQIVDVPHFSKSHLAILIQLADWCAYVVGRYIALKCSGATESYDGELVKVEGWYNLIGKCLVPSQHIDPPGKNDLCEYYRSIRPNGWSAKRWTL